MVVNEEVTGDNQFRVESLIRWDRWSYEENKDGKWKGWETLDFEKYQIKESDMRIKTATFTSPTYIDLTRGQVMICILSNAHENFYGYALTVEPKGDGLYEYSCQDFNREFTEKISIGASNAKVYNILLNLLGASSPANTNKDELLYMGYRTEKSQSGLLRPIEDYKIEAYQGAPAYNPMEQRINALWDKKTRGEIIRGLLYDTNAAVDFYFPNIALQDADGSFKYGVQTPAFEPYEKSKWLGEGLYFTTPEVAEKKLKFDITNVITGVHITKSDSNSRGTRTYYSSKDLLGVDLGVFFGRMETTESITTSTTTTGTDTTTSTTTTNNGAGAQAPVGSTVYINSDNIYSKSKDRKMLDAIETALESHGYKVINPHHIHPNYHVSDLRDNVPKNSYYFPIFGGICSGTFRDMASNYYQQYMKQKNVKVTLGFLAPPVKDDLDTLTWLKRAWDDNFSPSSFKGLANPGTYLKNHNFTYVYGSSGTDLGNKYYSGGGGLTTVAK